MWFPWLLCECCTITFSLGMVWFGRLGGCLQHRAPSLFSGAEWSFPSHLFYTTLWRWYSDFFIFKILQHSFRQWASWTGKCLKCLPFFQMCTGKEDSCCYHQPQQRVLQLKNLCIWNLLFVITRWWRLHLHLSNGRSLVSAAGHRTLPCPTLVNKKDLQYNCLCTHV